MNTEWIKTGAKCLIAMTAGGALYGGARKCVDVAQRSKELGRAVVCRLAEEEKIGRDIIRITRKMENRQGEEDIILSYIRALAETGLSRIDEIRRVGIDNETKQDIMCGQFVYVKVAEQDKDGNISVTREIRSLSELWSELEDIMWDF
jgi:hypothetical protein